MRGRLQGVGFRPTVGRMARALALDGDVRNAHGVLIRLAGTSADIEAFRDSLERAPRIDVRPHVGDVAAGFVIIESVSGAAHTQVSPDALVCEACTSDIADPANRRFDYGLTNCTHCGPRLSIVQAIPYDRARPAHRGPRKDHAMCLGIPGRIIKIDDAQDLVATVDVLGVKRRINIACIVDDEHSMEGCVGDGICACRLRDEPDRRGSRHGDPASSGRIGGDAGRIASFLDAPRRPGGGGVGLMSNQTNLQTLYPFLSGGGQDQGKLDVALIQSIRARAKSCVR